MIGTIANTVAIVVGSLVGGTVRHGLKEKYQEVLYVAMGLAATGLGINAVVQNMPNSSYPVLFIASLAIGGVVGTGLDLDRRFNDLVNKRKKNSDEGHVTEQGGEGAALGRSGAKADGAGDALATGAEVGAGDVSAARSDAKAPEAGDAMAAGAEVGAAPDLGRGLSTAIMLFCVGTLSILGPINSALYGDETFLFTNAMLDLVTSMVLASTFGYGIAIAAAVLFCWQGSIYLMASMLAPLLSGGLMCEISIVGGFLIFASGLSILKIKEISTMNLLPGLFVPPIWFALLAATSNFGGML